MITRGKFRRMTVREQEAGVGDVSSYSRQERRCLDVTSELFEPIPFPKRGSWIRDRRPKPQSYKRFCRAVFKAQVHGSYDTIFIQPVGHFGEDSVMPDMDIVLRYARAFFYGCRVEILPTIHLDKAPVEITRRTNQNTGKLQIKTGDLMNVLKEGSSRKLDRRKLVSIVLTDIDVYPNEDYNFVYGIADLMNGVGVWSLARFNPRFFEDSSEPLSEEENLLYLRRSIKVLCHEITHMFGIKHCVYFRCLMTGANHEEELDQSQSMQVCPCCLRKLQEGLKCSMVDRYKALYHAARQTPGFAAETKWFAARLDSVGANTEAPQPRQRESPQQERKGRDQRPRGRRVRRGGSNSRSRSRSRQRGSGVVIGRSHNRSLPRRSEPPSYTSQVRSRRTNR